MARIRAGDPGAEGVLAYLNGELLVWCIEADDTEGYALVYDGPPKFNLSEVSVKRLDGVIEFRLGSFDKS